MKARQRLPAGLAARICAIKEQIGEVFVIVDRLRRRLEDPVWHRRIAVNPTGPACCHDQAADD